MNDWSIRLDLYEAFMVDAIGNEERIRQAVEIAVATTGVEALLPTLRYQVESLAA